MRLGFGKRKFRDVVGNEDGVTLVEYGIAIGLAIAVGAPTLVVLAGSINARLNTAGTTMT